jgi:TP901 family phage tail tape measure protein
MSNQSYDFDLSVGIKEVLDPNYAAKAERQVEEHKRRMEEPIEIKMELDIGDAKKQIKDLQKEMTVAANNIKKIQNKKKRLGKSDYTDAARYYSILDDNQRKIDQIISQLKSQGVAVRATTQEYKKLQSVLEEIGYVEKKKKTSNPRKKATSEVKQQTEAEREHVAAVEAAAEETKQIEKATKKATAEIERQTDAREKQIRTIEQVTSELEEERKKLKEIEDQQEKNDADREKFERKRQNYGGEVLGTSKAVYDIDKINLAEHALKNFNTQLEKRNQFIERYGELVKIISQSFVGQYGVDNGLARNIDEFIEGNSQMKQLQSLATNGIKGFPTKDINELFSGVTRSLKSSLQATRDLMTSGDVVGVDVIKKLDEEEIRLGQDQQRLYDAREAQLTKINELQREELDLIAKKGREEAKAAEQSQVARIKSKRLKLDKVKSDSGDVIPQTYTAVNGKYTIEKGTAGWNVYKTVEGYKELIATYETLRELRADPSLIAESDALRANTEEVEKNTEAKKKASKIAVREFSSLAEYDAMQEKYQANNDGIAEYLEETVDIIRNASRFGTQFQTDLTTSCKKAKTAVERLFSAFDPDKYPALSGWKESILESIGNGYFSDREMYNGMFTGGYSWGVEALGEDRFYVYLNLLDVAKDKEEEYSAYLTQEYKKRDDAIQKESELIDELHQRYEELSELRSSKPSYDELSDSESYRRIIGYYEKERILLQDILRLGQEVSKIPAQYRSKTPSVAINEYYRTEKVTNGSLDDNEHHIAYFNKLLEEAQLDKRITPGVQITMFEGMSDPIDKAVDSVEELKDVMQDVIKIPGQISFDDLIKSAKTAGDLIASHPVIEPNATRDAIEENIGKRPVEVPIKPVSQPIVLPGLTTAEHNAAFGNGAVDELLKSYNVSVDAANIIADKFKQVAQLYKAMVYDADNNGGRNAEQINTQFNDYIQDIVGSIIRVGSTVQGTDTSLEKFMSFMKGSKIRYDDTDRAEFGDNWKFTRQRFGKFLTKSPSAMTADSVYMELLGQFPDLFSKDVINPSDQLKHILEMLGRAIDAKKNGFNILQPLADTDRERIEDDVYRITSNMYDQMVSKSNEVLEAEVQTTNAVEHTNESRREGLRLTEQIANGIAEESGEDVVEPIVDSMREINNIIELISSAAGKDAATKFLEGMTDQSQFKDRLSDYFNTILGDNSAWRLKKGKGSIVTQDDIAMVHLFNESTQDTLDIVLQLQDGMLKLAKGPKFGLTNTEPFDLESAKKFAEIQVRDLKANLGGRAYDGMNVLEASLGNIADPKSLEEFNNQLKIAKEEVKALKKEYASGSGSLNDFSRAGTVMRNSAEEIAKLQDQLKLLGEVDGVDRATEALGRMEAAARSFNEAQDETGQKTAYQQYNEAAADYNASYERAKKSKQVASAEAKVEAEQAKQDNQKIEQYYKNIVNIVSKINDLDSKINSFKLKDGGSGIYSRIIGSLEMDKGEFVAKLNQISNDVNTEFENMFVLTGDVKLPIGTFLDDLSNTNIPDTLSGFFNDTRVQAALTTEQIDKFIQTLQNSRNIKLDFSTKIVEQLNAVNQAMKKLTEISNPNNENMAISRDSGAYEKARQLYEDLTNMQHGFGDNISKWSTEQVAAFIQASNAVADYANNIIKAAEKEKQYFDSKRQYEYNNESGIVPYSGVDTARQKLEDYVNTFKDGQAIITGFKTSADGISKIDFSWIDEETGQLRTFSAELGRFTDEIHNYETTAKNLTFGTDAANKSFKTISDTIESLKGVEGTENEIQKLTQMRSELQQSIKDFRGSTDVGSQNTLKNIAVECDNAVKSANRLAEALKKANAAIESEGLKDFGTNSAIKTVDILTQTITKLSGVAGAGGFVGDLKQVLSQLRDAMTADDINTDDGQAKLKKLATEAEKTARAYDKLIGSGKEFSRLGNIDISGGSIRNNMWSLIQDSANGAKASFVDFNDKTNTLKYTLTETDGTVSHMSASMDGLTGSVTTSKGETEKLKTAWQEFTGALGGAGKSIMQYIGRSFTVWGIVSQLKKGFNAVREIDGALTELKKVTDETDATYNKFLQTMSSSARVVGSTVKDLTTMAAEWGRLGYSLEDSAKLAENTAILLNVSEFSDATSASEALISTMQAFQYTADESLHVVDVLNEVGNNYAVSSDGIATALQDSASALMEAGNSLEQSTALVAAANKVIQDPNSVGSALRTISLRLRGTSVKVLEQMGEETDNVVESTSKLQEKIKALTGVNILTDTGAYKSTYDILKEIGAVWQNLDSLDQSAALELLAGKNRANTLSAILNNTKDLEAAYESAMQAEGSALKENETYMNSIQGRIDQFNNSTQTMWMNFMNSDVLKFFIDLATKIINLVDDVGLLNIAIGAFAAKIAFSAKSFGQFFKLVNNNGVQQLSFNLKGATVNAEGLSIGAKAAAVGVQLLNSALTMGIAVLASFVISKAIEGIDNWVHRVENLREEVSELTNEYQKAKSTFDDNLTSLTTSSDSDVYASLEDEFKVLTKGVNAYGENISLTSDQYERYKAICEQICNINPNLKSGYDSVTSAIGNNASALENLIKLQKIQARQNAQDYTSDENIGKIFEDRKNQYKEMISNITVPNNIAYSTKIDKNGKEKSGYVNQIPEYIEKVIGIEKGKWDSTIDYIIKNADLIQRNMPDILKIAGEDFVDDKGQKWKALTQSQIDELYRFLEKTISDATEYKNGMIDTFLQVPSSMEQYESLSGAEQSFITDWIKNSGLFTIDENTTESMILEQKENIKQFIRSLANGDYTTKLDNGTTISASDILDSIYNFDTSDIKFDDYKTRIQELIDLLWNAIGGENNTLNIADKDALSVQLGIKFVGSEEGSEIDTFKKRVIELTGKTEEEVQEWIDSSPVNTVEAMVALDLSAQSEGITFEDIEEMVKPYVASLPIEIKTYSTLSESVESFNEALETSNELFANGAKATEDYFNSLVELGIDKTKLSEVIDPSTYIVTDVAKLKELIKAQKEELATETKLAKSQAQLKYHDLVRSLGDVVSSTMVFSNENDAAAESILNEIATVKKAINQYQLLEDSLLGVTNAFEDFASAQELDSQNTYGDSYVEMAQTMYDAIYKTGEVGTEAFWAAVRANVPSDIYADLAPGKEQIRAIADYLNQNVFSTLTLSDESFSIDYSAIEDFIENAQDVGIFTGTDASVFGLSANFLNSLADGEDALQAFADKMGMTKTQVYAMLSEMDKYNADGIGLSMLLQLDDSTAGQITLVTNELERLYTERKALLEQGASDDVLKENEADIAAATSQLAELEKQSEQTVVEYAAIKNAMADTGKQLKYVMPEEIITRLGLDGEATVESQIQTLRDTLLTLEEPTVIDLENTKRAIEELEKVDPKIEAHVKLNDNGLYEIVDGDSYIGEVDLQHYIELKNTESFIDASLKNGLTTTESLLSEIAENTAVMAGKESGSNEPEDKQSDGSESTSTSDVDRGQETSGNDNVQETSTGVEAGHQKGEPVELPVVFDIPKALSEAYKAYKSDIDEFNKLEVSPFQTTFGNIDTNNRQILEWTNENLGLYKDALESWYTDINGTQTSTWNQIIDDLRGISSTVFGASSNFDGVEIAFSPMLQTENGAVLLDKQTVDEYIYGLIDKAGEGWTKEDLLSLDTEGLEVDGQKIKGLIADVGDTAIQTGEAMHYVGADGSIAQNFKVIEDAAKEAGISVEDMMYGLRNTEGPTMIFPEEIGKTIDQLIDQVSKEKTKLMDDTWGGWDQDQIDYSQDLTTSLSELVKLKDRLNNGEDPFKVLSDLYGMQGTIMLDVEVDKDSAEEAGEAAVEAATEGANKGVGITMQGGVVNPKSFESTSVKSYSQLQGDITSLNSVLSQSEEFIENNIKITQEYKDSLLELCETQDEIDELNACFDTGSKLVVKNSNGIKKLIGQKKKELATDTKLSKAQSKLEYYNLYKDLKKLTSGLGYTSDGYAILTDAQREQVNSLYEEMNAARSAVAQFSLLEMQLLGTTNAYTRFQEAQNTDSENNYSSQAESMVETFANALNTGDLGTASAREAMLALVPEEVYANLDTVEEKLDAVAKYFNEGELSKYFSIDFDDNGGISGVETTTENLQQFVADGIEKGLFTGDWEHFDLSENITSLEQFDKEMGITEEVAYAMFEALESHDAGNLFDPSNILEKLVSGNIEYQAYQNAQALADLDYQLANGTITAKEYSNKLIGLDGQLKAGKISEEEYNKAVAALKKQLEAGTIKQQEYNAAVAGLSNQHDTIVQQAYDEVTAYSEKSEALEKAKEDLEKYNEMLETGVDENGNPIDREQVQKDIEATTEEIKTLVDELSKLKEPTEIVIELAMEHVQGQIDDVKEDIMQLAGNDVKVHASIETVFQEVENSGFDLSEFGLTKESDGSWTGVAEFATSMGLDPNAPGVIDTVTNYINLIDQQHTLSLMTGEEAKDTLETLSDISTVLQAIADKLGADYTLNVKTKMDTDPVTSFLNTPLSKTISVGIKKIGSGFGLADGTVHANGTANISGAAHATGSWGAPKTETALVGELGPELLVRNGRWHTVGENGAEFTDVQRGDIIFNHKQTADLLSKGYVTGRGKAFAEGTAYAGIYTYDKYRGKEKDAYKGSGISNAASKLSKAASAISKSSDKLSDDFKEIFDWIAVRIEEITNEIDVRNARLDNAVGSSKQNAIIDDIIGLNKSLYDNLTAGASKYYEYAQKLLEKVPAEYREAAQNGAIAIESFTGKVGESALEAIQDYREWVQKGDDLTQQAEETLTEISSLAKQAVDNIASDYDNKKSIKDSKIDQYEAYNSLLETDVGFESEKIYQAMMSENKSNIGILQKQRDAMLAELNKRVESGEIKKYSQDWYDVVNDISAVDTEIIELKTDIEDYQDSINELHWDKFDLLMDKLNAVSDEADNLIDVLSSKDLVNKDTAEWTDEGITTLGLYAQKMDAAEVQAKKYEEQINYLNKNWKKLGYTEEEYIDKLDELKSGQYDAIKAYNESKDAIVDLNKTRVEAIKDGIQKEIDAYKELIDKKKEELDSEKDLYDFQKSVNEKQKDIAKIQRQLAALAGDNSASAKAKRAQLEAELLDAQADLEETYYDRSVSNQQEALDKELESFEDAKNDEMEGWDEYLENTNKVVSDSLDVVKANTNAIYQELQTMGQEYGLSITESLISPWKEGENAIQAFSEKFGLAMSATVDELKKLELEFMKTMEKIEKSGSTSVDTVKNNATGYQSAEYKPPKQEESSGGGSSSGSSSGNSGGGDSGGKSYPYGKASETSGNIKEGARGNQVKAIQYALNQLGYGNSGTKSVDGKFGSGTKSAVRAFQKAMGISADGIVGKNTRAKFRAKGYKFGTTGVDTDQFAWIDEMGLEEIVLHAQDGKLAYLTKGSAVLPHSISENLMKLGQLDPQYMLDINRPQASVSPSIINNTMELSVDNSIGTLISIENFDGNNPDEITKVVNKALEQHTKNLNNALRKFAR